MSPLSWLILIATLAMVAVAVALGRATRWGQAGRWKAPHRRYVQDYHDGDEALTDEERKALAELEALNLHRRHPYC